MPIGEPFEPRHGRFHVDEWGQPREDPRHGMPNLRPFPYLEGQFQPQMEGPGLEDRFQDNRGISRHLVLQIQLVHF